MILSKEIEVKWSKTNHSHFLEKGYSQLPFNTPFKIKVEDLPEGSQAKILATCSHCKRIYIRSYKLINNALKSVTGKYFCFNCIPQRSRATIQAKQELGLLKKGNEGYYTFKENIEKEILLHIEKHGTLDGLARINGSLDNAIRANDDRELYAILGDMGLNFRDYLSITPESYIKDFSNIKRDINIFIEREGRFPTVHEIVADIRLDYRIISNLGGMNEFRKKIGYVGTDRLIDDSGYKNRSVFEYRVAQYLIHNNIFAKRDGYPFPGTRHTCDFIVEDIEGNKYYIECWGYDDASTNSVARVYCKKRELKESLYREHNLNLISVDLKEIYQLNNERFQKELAKKFSVFANRELKIFKNVEYLDVNEITNEQLLEIVMKYSDDPSCLPYANALKDNEHFTVYRTILGRFGRYEDFAKHFGKKTLYGSNKESIQAS